MSSILNYLTGNRKTMNCSFFTVFSLLLLLSIIPTCNENEPLAPVRSAISITSSFKDKILTTYPILAAESKADSLDIHFTYKYLNSAITIDATIDSGRTWFSISTQSVATVSGSYTWNPSKNNIDRFNYCGGKSALIRISTIDTACISDTFAILGSIPYEINKPLNGAAFSYNNRVTLVYTRNCDLTAKIKTMFKPLNSKNWIEFTTIDSSLRSYSNTIETKTASFLPADSIYKQALFTQPISLLIKDYGNQNAISSIVDSIIITM